MARRIVTGNTAEGRSYFVSDEALDDPYLWQTGPDAVLGGTPAPLLPSNAPLIDPARGGTKCVRFFMEPWAVVEQTPYPGLAADGFHRTATIDYIMVLSGEVDLVLDEGRTTVRAGDLVVQRNTNHAWRNMTDEPTEMWGVMVWVE